MSLCEASGGYSDGIFQYFNSNIERKQYHEDGSTKTWYTRTPYITEAREIHLIKKDGKVNLVTYPEYTGPAILPICTIG